MVEIPKQITIEEENIQKALENLKESMGRADRSFVELAAIATCLHNVYSGIENILKQLLKFEQIEIKKNEMWHKELLKQAVNKKIITDKVRDDLYEYLTFRHFFVHSYGFMLEKEKLEVLANKIAAIYEQFRSAVYDYICKK